MAKGIRVNQLAKELNVESKAILHKLADEGLADKAPNHMSVLPLGLAESVREWHRNGEIKAAPAHHGGAVATAEAPEPKPKTPRKKPAKKVSAAHAAEADGHTDEAGGDSGYAEEHVGTAAVAEAPVTAQETVGTASDVETTATVVETNEAGAAAVSTPEAEQAPGETSAAAAESPASAPAAPAAGRAAVAPARPVAPKVVAPVPFTPKPATARGPNVIIPPSEPVRPTRFGKAAAPAPAGPGKAAAKAPAPVAASAPAKAPAGPAVAPSAPGTPATGAPATPVRPAAAGPGQRPGNGGGAAGIDRPAVVRAPVTLESKRAAEAAAAAKNAPPARPVQFVVPTQAKIQGPKIVRVEKPEPVSAPRGPRPVRGAQDAATTFTQARPAMGRGVTPRAVDDEEEEKKKAAAKNKSPRRRGVDGRRGEAMEKLKEFSEADLIERAERLGAASTYRTGFDSHLKKSETRGTHVQARTAVQKGGAIEIEEPITVKSLSAALGIKTNDILRKLMAKGVFANQNQTLDTDTASVLAMEYGIELAIRRESTLEEQLMAEVGERQAKEEDLRPRPPVVTILGHVDHGKTSLLDKIRHANVAAGEAGGITQHTAAWMVEITGSDGKAKRVTFIDTPGHQAFTSMRARGANMTDIVVLVVSAAEGVQPQTVESINHARAAGVPIVVALNKIDRPDANPDMVLGQLAKEGLNPVEWGGEIEVVRTSAHTGEGIETLIETLDYQAELLELKADPTSPARGTVIESRRDEGLGSVATVLVQDGTLRVGDIGLCGAGYGRIRSVWNDRGESIQEAGPSTPVVVSGLSAVPSAGDAFFSMDDLERARSIGEERAALSRQQVLGAMNKVTAENLFATMKAGDVQTINLIIKADVQGSVETLVGSVTGQNTEEVKVRVIHSGVGPVTESDVNLAIATKQKANDNRVAIIGFHVTVEEAARQLAEQNHVDVKLYRVIYEIFDDLKKALSGMLAPEEREKLHGHAEVRQVFKVSKVGNIAGCMVTDGHIQRGSKIRLIRNGAVITEGLTLESLKRVKDDVKEVKTGFECGMKLAGYDDIKVGDVFEAYVKETFERTL